MPDNVLHFSMDAPYDEPTKTHLQNEIQSMSDNYVQSIIHSMAGCFILLWLLFQTHLHHITIPLFPCHWHSLSFSSFSTKSVFITIS